MAGLRSNSRRSVTGRAAGAVRVWRPLQFVVALEWAANRPPRRPGLPGRSTPSIRRYGHSPRSPPGEPMVYRRFQRLAAPMLLALAVLPLPLLAAKQPGAESPQALVARLRAAAEENDFPELVDCIAPKERQEMAAGLVLGTTMMVAFMDMGSEMATGMGQAMTEGMSGSEMTAEQKAEMEKGKAEARAK